MRQLAGHPFVAFEAVQRPVGWSVTYQCSACGDVSHEWCRCTDPRKIDWMIKRYGAAHLHGVRPFSGMR